MKKIKKNKGVTLVALALTIVVATLLIVSVSVSVDKLSTSNDFYKTRQDIIALQKAVQTYYLAHDNQLPPGTNTIAYNFTSVITAEENEQDRNPNDGDIYYVLYQDNETYKNFIKNNFPEVNISNTKNTYVINKDTLTVYCAEGYLMEGITHYTASEQFSGGQFASEYYKKAGENENGSIKIYTDTKIKVNNNIIDFSNYAVSWLDSSIYSGGHLYIEISNGNEYYRSADGSYNKITSFDDYDKKPSLGSFKLVLHELDGSEINGVSEISAESYTPINENGSITRYKYTFKLDSLDFSNERVRKIIDVIYDSNNSFYYDSSNQQDWNEKIKRYIDGNPIEYETTGEEILIADAIKNNATLSSQFNSNNTEMRMMVDGSYHYWDYSSTYSMIVTPRGERYVVESGDTQIYRTKKIEALVTFNAEHLKSAEITTPTVTVTNKIDSNKPVYKTAGSTDNLNSGLYTENIIVKQNTEIIVQASLGNKFTPKEETFTADTNKTIQLSLGENYHTLTIQCVMYNLKSAYWKYNSFDFDDDGMWDIDYSTSSTKSKFEAIADTTIKATSEVYNKTRRTESYQNGGWVYDDMFEPNNINTSTGTLVIEGFEGDNIQVDPRKDYYLARDGGSDGIYWGTRSFTIGDHDETVYVGLYQKVVARNWWIIISGNYLDLLGNGTYSASYNGNLWLSANMRIVAANFRTKVFKRNGTVGSSYYVTVGAGHGNAGHLCWDSGSNRVDYDMFYSKRQDNTVYPENDDGYVLSLGDQPYVELGDNGCLSFNTSASRPKLQDYGKIQFNDMEFKLMGITK